MKTIILYFLLFSLSSMKAQDVEKVRPKYSEINTIVATVNDKLKKFINPNKTVFVVCAYKKNNTFLVQVSVFQKSDFGWFLRDNEVDIFGFFEYDQIPVVVFGNASDVLFTETKEKMVFEWLKALPPLDKDIIVISNFEPPAWNYEFLNGTFNFKGTDYWNY